VVGEKAARLRVFLRVVLENVVRSGGVFCGEFVVDCVVNVVSLMVDFPRWKNATFSKYIFRRG
jgi:hypothetical protein